LLTGNSEYLRPYADGKSRIATHLASLGSGLANRTDHERLLQSQLESLVGSKETEMERSITLREQGYRRRAFNLVDTNEGQGYMDEARSIVSSLSLAESSSFAKFDTDRKADLRQAQSETVIANLCLLVLTVGLLLIARYHGRALEQETVRNRRGLTVRDSQLEKLTSALSNQARSKMLAIETDARLLLENYGGFLPHQGQECAEHIKETAAQMEQLRKDLLGRPGFDADEKAA
jgi:hypothetical protein